MKQQRRHHRFESQAHLTPIEARADFSTPEARYGHDYARLSVYPSADGLRLPPDLRERMEAAFATDFNAVRVHPSDPEVVSRGLAAFARDGQLHFAAGQYQPDTPIGAELVAHELAHVVQQRQGRAESGNPALETEAERAASDALGSGHAGLGAVPPARAPTAASGVVQALVVGPADVGKAFQVTTNTGLNVTATLVAIKGGGWYDFQLADGTPVKVHGSSNIHAPAAAPAPAPAPAAAQPTDALSRLQRAHERGEARMTDAPPLGQRVDAPTPLGMTGLSRQRFSPTEPQTTTRQADFPGTSQPGAPYSGWVSGLPQATFQPIVNSLVTGAPPVGLTPQQRRDGAMLVGTTHYSEPYRFPGAAKIARSGMQQIADGDAVPTDFPTLFPMAQPGGSGYYQEVLNGTRALTATDREVLEAMSESSDGEEADYYMNPQDL